MAKMWPSIHPTWLWPMPWNTRLVHRLFVRDFGTITWPLHWLIESQQSVRPFSAVAWRAWENSGA